MRIDARIAAGAAFALLLTACQGQMRDQISRRAQQDPLPNSEVAVPRAGYEATFSLIPGPTGGPANPVAVDPTSIKRGGEVYGVNCSACHGFDAKGGDSGKVGQLMNPKPFDLTSDQVASLSDGSLYAVITNGFGTMPPYAHHIVPKDRWALVNYLRTLQHRGGAATKAASGSAL